MSAAAPSVVWRPQPGPQTALLGCPIEDVFFGGARGGGKTDGLLGDFVAHADQHGKNARGVLFRRTYSPELEEVIARSKTLLGALGWNYHETQHRWTAPNGAILLLRRLERDEDANDYQGHQYTWQGFDELPNWPTSTGIDKLYACLRSPAGVPCVRRSTGNPGGVGHSWVRKRYRLSSSEVQPFVPFEFAPLASMPELKIESVFIPSRLEDNILLQTNDPKYEARIAAGVGGSEALWQGWRMGNWDIQAGQFFDMWEPAKHIRPISALGLEFWHERWASLDWGYAHETVILLHARIGDVYVTLDERVLRETEGEGIGAALADMVRPCGTKECSGRGSCDHQKLSAVYLSPDAFARKQDERTIAIRIGEVLHQRGLPEPSPAVNDRVNGARMMGASLSNGTWLIADRCRRLIEQIPLMQRDPDHPEDVLKVDGDDAYDAARYGLMSRPKAIGKPEVVQISERLARIEEPTSRAIMARKWESQWAKPQHAAMGGRRHRG